MKYNTNATYQVIAKNKRGYTQEEQFMSYTSALHYAIECLDSDQYMNILINKFDQDNTNDTFNEAGKTEVYRD